MKGTLNVSNSQQVTPVEFNQYTNTVYTNKNIYLELLSSRLTIKITQVSRM